MGFKVKGDYFVVMAGSLATRFLRSEIRGPGILNQIATITVALVVSSVSPVPWPMGESMGSPGRINCAPLSRPKRS
jgi:hypothetical protein